MKNLKKEQWLNLKIAISSFIISTLLGSCNVSNNDINYKLSLTENLNINTDEYGELIYDSDLDTIKLKKTDLRSIRLYLGVFQEDMSIKELKKTKLDTFVKIKDDSNKIPFILSFNKKGKFQVCGYIEDKVFLNNYLGSNKTRIISNEFKVSGEVNVVEKNDL